MTHREVGDLVVLSDTTYVVLMVTRRFTPYRRKGQTTRCEGLTLGLKRVEHYP